MTTTEKETIITMLEGLHASHHLDEYGLNLLKKLIAPESHYTRDYPDPRYSQYETGGYPYD